MVKECLCLFSYDGDDITVSSPIRENTYMATPNELYEALDVLLDGIVDPREIIEKMGPDAADCHVNAPLRTFKLKKRKKKEKIEKGINLKALINPYSGKPTGMAGASAHKPGVPLAAKLNSLKKPSSFKAPGSYKPGEALQRRLQEKKSGLSKGFTLKDVKSGSEVLLGGAKKAAGRTTAKGRYKQEMDQNYANRTIAAGAAKGRKSLVKLGMAGSAGAGAAAGAYGMAQHKNKKFKSLVEPEPVIKSMTWDAEITGIDEDRRQVFGWATVTHVDGEEVIDRQGDYIPLEEIEKAAYNYVLTSRVGGDMHSRDGDAPKHTADLIESVIVTPEKAEAMGLTDAKNYGWWLGMKINDDEQWELVKKGERQGFSIHGKGKRTDHS